jgi:hypothetical protein
MSAIDTQFEFSDAQALANISSGASTLATNQEPTGSGNKDAWGTAKDGDLAGVFNCTLGAAMVGAGATLRCDLVTKASASSMSSGSTVLASVTFPATAAAGTRKAAVLPVGTTSLGYVSALYTAVGGKLTSATMNCWLGAENEVPG